jgi:hypothetical protein
MTTKLAPPLEVLAQLRTEWPRRGWSWDARLSCVASSFDTEVAEKARAAVLRALPTMWSERTMPHAPEAIREIGERSGGVRAEQLVFAGDTDVSVVSYGLWWPWGNGATISLRVGVHASRDYSAALCEIFGVAPG